ncbi:uncharacterized protein EV154DRAFT_512752 [Mucor mucedo]|uniref:uncharacterized protein n=1 Tax=Mucor mucedo TaxID=29922 RepID=UPI00221E3B93|nr:uncharacterized protein EV154DRAFT_512752 [Mucor mucedo]KAI7890044.1 hypothetical protein EV154DRAFT_512752 [Mucor mucedo]
MDDIISDCLQLNPNFDTDTNNISWFINSGSKKLECLLEKVQLKEIFAKRNCVLAIAVETVRQASYILLFKIMYLRYINQLIEENLNANFKNDWVNKNIAYNVSIDKNVLDNVFGSKEDLNELFYASGILRKEDQHRKVLFSTYGEEIFPTIQQKLPDLKFKMKMYFVVAQIYSTHIHVALHQAVRLKSVEENGVSIVVQDKIIPIDNLYKALCKILWTNISSDIVINYCEQHNNETNTLVYDFYSTQNHGQILKTLELSVLKIFNAQNTNLDMDYKKEISINHKNCTCSFTLSFRTIIEMGINPTLQSAAKVIAASLTSAELFGSYEVDYLFLLGNPFSFSSDSQVYNAYIVLMQNAICLGIESKGKDTQFIYLRDTITDLVQSTVYNKNCLYEKFTMGTLRQVLKDTYAVRLKDHFAHKFVPFSRISKCENDTASDMVGEGSFLIVFRRGQTIPMTGLTLKINLGHLMHRYSTLVAEFIRVDTSNEKLPNDSDILPKDSQGPKFDLFGYEDKNNISFERLVLNLKYTNYNYSLQLSMRETGYKVEEYMFKDIGDPLTLAYIHSH